MSHYWDMKGEITLPRPLNQEEHDKIKSLFMHWCCYKNDEVNLGETLVFSGNSDESIVIEDTTIKIDGNENHFPGAIDEVLHCLNMEVEGSGTYHAEDNMSGEWWIENNMIEIKAYAEIVKELRAETARLARSYDQLWSRYTVIEKLGS